MLLFLANKFKIFFCREPAIRLNALKFQLLIHETLNDRPHFFIFGDLAGTLHTSSIKITKLNRFLHPFKRYENGYILTVIQRIE